MDAEDVLSQFRAVYRADREAGQTRSLDSYRRVFTGFESLIEAAPRPDDGLRAKDRADVRVYALQEWLEAVKLASERLDS